MRLTLVATAWLVLLAASDCYAKPSSARNKNGIRLVTGYGPRGRLEISTKEPYFLQGLNRRVAWIPVCQYAVDDSTAEIMCKMLGYNFGRQYITPKVAYPPKETSKPAGVLMCTPAQNSSRRMLRAATDSPIVTAIDKLAGRSGARSLSPLVGEVNTPAKSPYTCLFVIGDCDSTGPLAGVECSHTPMPDAPPPPPSPPNTPPAPPPVSDFIRLIGGSAWPTDNGDVEPNLCPSDEFCEQYSRVEVQVDHPTKNDTKIWAPVCGAATPELMGTMADIGCQQVFDWPSARRLPIGYVWSNVPETEPRTFAIPRGPATEDDDFEVSEVMGWVTILGSKAEKPLMLQDLDYKVSSTPCENGSLFAVMCRSAWVRRR